MAVSVKLIASMLAVDCHGNTVDSIMLIANLLAYLLELLNTLFISFCLSLLSNYLIKERKKKTWLLSVKLIASMLAVD